METNNRDQQIIGKIIKYCSEIEKTHESFGNKKELFFDKNTGFIYRNSIAMPILQIGELSGKLSEAFRSELVKGLSDEFKSAYNDIPWRDIARMRDFFAHRYGTMDYDMTWNTSVNDVPMLKKYLESLNLA